MTDAQLIEAYCAGSPDALAGLVARHMDWVYSMARRRVVDPALAEDVAQATFIVLQRKLPGLRVESSLEPWLFKVVAYTASAAVRSARRRRRNEKEVAAMSHLAAQPTVPDNDSDLWRETAPLLDELVGKLSSVDRHAVLLRFYQRRSYAQIGAALDVSEDAARKRVDRAVAKLRDMFAARGVVAPSAALAGVMMSHTTASASATLAAATLAAINGAAGGSLLAALLANKAAAAMAWAKATTVLATTAAATAASIAVIVTIVHVAGPAPTTSNPNATAVAAAAAPGTPTATTQRSASQSVRTSMPSARTITPPPAPGDWARLSPFTSVIVTGDAARVVYEKNEYDLVSVDGLTTSALLAFSRKTYGDNWEERFAADLVDVMDAMGRRPTDHVKLVLREPGTGRVTTVDRAPLTPQNRAAVISKLRERQEREGDGGRGGGGRGAKASPAALGAALDDFERALEERWSYLAPSGFDHRAMIAPLRERVRAGMSEAALAVELQRVIGRGIDGHAMIEDWELTLPSGYLPFLIEPARQQFVAFRADRGGFVDEHHPVVESLDGKRPNEWIAAASAFVPDGSLQFVRREGLRLMRAVQFLRQEMALPLGPTIEVALRSHDGARRMVLTLPVARRMPAYGKWPRPDQRPTLPPGIAYLRLAAMSDDMAVPDLAAARGLIIDVRDNGGGSRDALRAIGPRLMRPGDPPRVINAAVARLHADHDAEHMASRFLYPENWNRCSDAERDAIATFEKTFRPAWPVPAKGYGPWHYTVLSPGGVPIDKRLVVLMNGKCFSATDVFLSGLKGLPNVTLLGTPSGGGSANVNSVRLGDTPLHVRLGTIVSFQSTGQLFDGVGVEPDVLVEPEPDFFIGGRDGQLEAAIRLLTS